MKVEPRRLEAFLRKPDVTAVLVYGPDQGLVRERADALARTAVPDLSDPFRVAVLTGRVLSADPARLADEAAAIAFGGGRRVIRVRDTGEEAALVLAPFLQDPKGDALVVIEAGELGPRSRLRTLFEASSAGAALPCYADTPESVAGLIETRLRQDRISIAPDALEFLVAHLGSDRLVTRGEVDKLALYAGPGTRVELADAMACVGDSGSLSLDEIAFAVGDGDVQALMRALDRAYAEGNAAVPILRAVSRHFQRLHLAAGLVEKGQRPDQAIGSLRPPVFFKLRDGFVAQLRRWPLAWLATAIERLTTAEVGCKTTGMPDQALCARTLIEIARAGGRRKGAA